jgi:hypothetical protein
MALMKTPSLKKKEHLKKMMMKKRILQNLSFL